MNACRCQRKIVDGAFICAISTVVHGAQIILRNGITLLARQTIPEHALLIVDRNTFTPVGPGAQLILDLLVDLLGCIRITLNRSAIALRNTNPLVRVMTGRLLMSPGENNSVPGVKFKEMT